jgi:hypothetical protein
MFFSVFYRMTKKYSEIFFINWLDRHYGRHWERAHGIWSAASRPVLPHGHLIGIYCIKNYTAKYIKKRKRNLTK